jgi:hypothetical protein
MARRGRSSRGDSRHGVRRARSFDRRSHEPFVTPSGGGCTTGRRGVPALRLHITGPGCRPSGAVYAVRTGNEQISGSSRARSIAFRPDPTEFLVEPTSLDTAVAGTSSAGYSTPVTPLLSTRPAKALPGAACRTPSGRLDPSCLLVEKGGDMSSQREGPRPTIRTGSRYGQPRRRVKGGGYGKPPRYRKARSDRGTKLRSPRVVVTAAHRAAPILRAP